MYLIFMVFLLVDMFTVLKWLEIFYSPYMPFLYSLLLGGLTCLGVTAGYFALNSYWLNSDIASAVKNLVDMSSDPISVILLYMNWGTRFQKSYQLVDRCKRLSLNIDPNYVCRLHWRKAGCLLEEDIVIFITMLKGEICRRKYFSIERGRWKCLGMRDYISSDFL